jgi:hypothetical protein
LIVRAGHRGDAPVALDLIGAMAPALCLANAAYDSDAIRKALQARRTRPVILNNPTRVRRHPFDRRAYEVYRVASNLMNGRPPRYRDKMALPPGPRC